MCMGGLLGSHRDQISEMRVTDGCKLPWGCWKLNLGPVLLTAEPSLQPGKHPFLSASRGVSFLYPTGQVVTHSSRIKLT